MNKISWEAKLIKHNGATRIGVYFEKGIDLIERIKKLAGVDLEMNL